MSNVDKIAKDLAGIIKNSDSKGTAPYDTKATVKKVENGIAWVQIPGGVDETPVQMTLAAKEGDTVQVRVSGGRAWITGNGTAPPTDDARANDAYKAADKAYSVAESAIMDAQRAHEAADSAEASAGQAQTSAENAGEYAARALGNLSTVQSVTETLNWITAHGTMTITTDTALDPTHVYFVRDNNGDYEVGNYHYSVVTEPKLEDISTYYVLSIDESLNNYVATHLAVDGEGLWVLPDANGYKVLIATGAGSTYTAAGTYIVDSNGDTGACFGTTAQIGKDGETRAEIDYHSLQLIDGSKNPNVVYFHVSNILDSEGKLTETFTADGTRTRFNLSQAPVENETTVKVDDVAITSGVEVYGPPMAVIFDEAPASGSVITVIYTPDPEYRDAKWLYAYTFGTRRSESWLGSLSVSEGYNNAATAFCSHAEGYETNSGSEYCHSEGQSTKAVSPAAHSEGYKSEARGQYSHAQNCWTIAKTYAQTALGKHNVEDSNGTYAVIVGNGTADDARSNALTVAWDGNVELALDTTAASGTTDGDLYAAITALGWQNDVIV